MDYAFSTARDSGYNLLRFFAMACPQPIPACRSRTAAIAAGAAVKLERHLQSGIRYLRRRISRRFCCLQGDNNEDRNIANRLQYALQPKPGVRCSAVAAPKR